MEVLMFSRSRARRSAAPPSPRRARAALAMVFLSAFVVDCAQERDPINRVDQGALRKSFFVGRDYTGTADDPEFYVNNFVVDSSADNSLMPAGTYDDVDRIHWEIQENLLVARKSYEYITGSDQVPSTARRTPNGIIVAAYKIESQFDIRRSYNPSTGEELNIVEENTSDRRWFDRDYIRVDWSRNLVDNPDWAWVWYGSLFGELSFSPVAWDETNPHSQAANNFCEMEPGMVQGPDGTCIAAPNARNHPGGYFDVTSKWLVSPANSYFFGEAIPTCLIANFFAHGPVYSCNPQESVIRTSFRRVEDHDFEALELTRAPYDLVGGPRADRNGYDTGYGVVDENFHRYQMIHNVWMRSHLRDAQGQAIACDSNTDANTDGTADACGQSTDTQRAGSQCDLVAHACTIPYRQRTVRPIAYYVNDQMPPEMQDHVVVNAAARTYRLPTPSDAASTVVRGPSEEIVATWDLAIMAAIANARETECRRTGGARDACHAQFFDDGLEPQELGAFLGARPKATNGPAVVICHNPVLPTDSTACREPGYRARLGDVRYNHITYFPGRSRSPFGGIAHWGYDPLTGEVVTNGATTVGRSAEIAAAQQRDYILMALGELDVNAYVQGAASQRFASLLRNPGAAVRPALSTDELTRRVNAVNGRATASAVGLSVQRARSPVQALADHDRMTVTPTATSQAGAGGASSQLQARFNAQAAIFRDTSLEADMVDSSWLANFGFDPASRLTGDLLDRASPLRQMDPEFAESMWTQLLQRAERRGFCFQDAGAPGAIGSEDIQGVARWFAQRYASLTPAERAVQIYEDLRIEAYKGIALHEVGHSLGLYHLPVSSYDSMNYNPQYWQLRTHNGTAEATCTPVCNANRCDSVRNTDRNQDNCMGPRYLDPESDDELGLTAGGEAHAGINYFGNTSTMEYQWERFGETVGLGAYDHYAMGILYGRVIETMESDPARGGMPTTEQQRFGARMSSNLGELDQINWTDPVLGETGVLPIHYTSLAREMKMYDPARCRTATDEEKARYRWRIVNGQLCSYPPRDHAAMVDFESTAATPSAESAGRVAPYWRTRAGTRTGENQLRWAYRVAWDIGVGYPHINYFDQGADLYEVAQSQIRKYELTYPTMYFRRERREFSGFSIPAYLARWIFRTLRGYHWTVARDVAYYSSVFSSDLYNRVARDDNWMRPYLATQTDLFDFFAGVMLRPEVGQFEPMTDQLADRRPIFDAGDPAENPLFEVGVIDGRFIGEEFDNVLGGSWDYQAYMERAGSYPEKPLAAIMLTDTRPTFSSITRSLYLDGREFQVNFRTDMPTAFDRLIGGVLSEDWDTTAMHVPVVPGGGTAGLPALSPALLPLWSPPTRTDTFGEPHRPAGSRLLFPNIGYRQQLPTMVWSMLFSSLNSDLSTIHRMRIWTPGGPEVVDVPESEQVHFTNPETGITYAARSYGPDRIDGEQIDSGIASRMIAHANELLRDTYQIQVDSHLQPIVNPDGSYTVVFDSNRRPVRANADDRRQTAAEIRFRNYVGLIDATRYASRLLGYGLLR